MDEKKTYEKPEMKVVKIASDLKPLCGSCDGSCPDEIEVQTP